MDNMTSAGELRKAIEKVAREAALEATRSCWRVKKAKVITAPSNGTCTVRINGDSANITIPYSSATSTVVANDIVLVGYAYNDMRNAIVWQKYDFS